MSSPPPVEPAAEPHQEAGVDRETARQALDAVGVPAGPVLSAFPDEFFTAPSAPPVASPTPTAPTPQRLQAQIGPVLEQVRAAEQNREAQSNGRLPAGMRNNNPGNLMWTRGQVNRYGGVVGPSTNLDYDAQTGATFPQTVFRTPAHGMRAAYELALRRYNEGRLNANQLVAERGGWTPGNWQAAANIARGAGLRPDQDINLRDPESAFRFMRALLMQEHGPASRMYSDQLIRDTIAIGQTPVGPTRMAVVSPDEASMYAEAPPQAVGIDARPQAVEVVRAAGGPVRLAGGGLVSDSPTRAAPSAVPAQNGVLTPQPAPQVAPMAAPTVALAPSPLQDADLLAIEAAPAPNFADLMPKPTRRRPMTRFSRVFRSSESSET